MATHNMVLRLGEAMYLEVIAPNPSAPAPERPRWFALDTLGPSSPPALSAWVVRTADIRAPLGGQAPALIEWHTDTHPAAELEDKGLSLARLEIHSAEPDRVARLLRSLELDAPGSVLPAPPGENPRLAAYINTPRGLRLLSARLNRSRS